MRKEDRDRSRSSLRITLTHYASHRPPPGEEADDEADQGEHEHDVDQGARRLEGDEADQPDDEQDGGQDHQTDGHRVSLLNLRRAGPLAPLTNRGSTPGRRFRNAPG